MAKTIICIHGRLNKPKKSTLKKWWKTAIKEGLAKNTRSTFSFPKINMAYYADISYPDGPIPDKKEPYKKAKRGALKSYKEGWVDKFRETAGSLIGDSLDWLIQYNPILSEASRLILKGFLEDLSKYYSNQTRREQISKRLKELLVEHKDNEIILIAHSMGAIVAYDVLSVHDILGFPNFPIPDFFQHPERE